MPGRKTPLISGQYYHVFNRGIDRRPTFTNKREYSRASQALFYYHFASPQLKLANYLKLSGKRRKDIIERQKNNNDTLVSIIAYCFMPNHFHFLLRQNLDKGISDFISRFLNSYTRYFNTRHERVGPIFLNKFKAVRVQTDEQLLHLTRYIHLNPYSSHIIEDKKDILKYKYSSLREYLGFEKFEICQKKEILSFWDDKKSYEKFIMDQADYQRRLDEIKHLTFDG